MQCLLSLIKKHNHCTSFVTCIIPFQQTSVHITIQKVKTNHIFIILITENLFSTMLYIDAYRALNCSYFLSRCVQAGVLV